MRVGAVYTLKLIRATLRSIFKAQLENHQGLGYTELTWEAGDWEAGLGGWLGYTELAWEAEQVLSAPTLPQVAYFKKF